MAENDDLFSKEYRIGTETEATPKRRPLPHPTDSIPGIDIEAKRYGIAKPRRVIIRAKIIHDQD